jgi:hypothetical protein
MVGAWLCVRILVPWLLWEGRGAGLGMLPDGGCHSEGWPVVLGDRL